MCESCYLTQVFFCNPSLILGRRSCCVSPCTIDRIVTFILKSKLRQVDAADEEPIVNTEGDPSTSRRSARKALLDAMTSDDEDE